ncbi:MAG: energy-coupling factor transporter transmembrane protein EcfT [Nitrospirae bacterium]|nr:energy-coupling factor transporter transmembrane protein EcfT [Nitrospirota bacterium]
MSPESKITAYIAFIVSIFLVQGLIFYIFILIFISLLLLKIPFAALKKGWIPISLFLAFTFFSNIFFSHGKVLCSFGVVMITEEGLHIAAIRTLRIFFMIACAKILTATTPIEVLVGAFGKILSPLERIGLPVGEFFSTMGLTLKCFPTLKEYLSENYKNHRHAAENNGFFKKVKVISSFLLPMFIQSMRSPEKFFQEKKAETDSV